MDSLERSILLTLAWADLFDSALTARRAWRLLHGLKAGFAEVEEGLSALSRSGTIGASGGYFHLAGRERCAEASREGASLARPAWAEASDFAAELRRIDSVLMVAVTGSLAAGGFRPGDDIDLLVVTRPGSLWTTLAACRKLARRAPGPRGRFCLNYFISSDSLEIGRRNVFTAVEIAQLSPLFGARTYDLFRERNRWVLDHLPNSSGLPEEAAARVSDAGPAATGFRAATGVRPGGIVEALRLVRSLLRYSRRAARNPDCAFGRSVFKRHYGEKQATILSRFAEAARGLELPAASCASSPEAGDYERR